jgi:hypothetical protein
MSQLGDIKYRKECMSCGRQFSLNALEEKIPKHPPKSQGQKRLYPFIPCIGSGTTGFFIGTVIKGID